jgi:hypothetical protein
MGVDTFDTLTPDEFAAIMAKHNEYLDAKMRDEWERARIMATILIQPHITRKITPEKLLPLPWDKKRKSEKTKTPEVSRKEHLQRFRDIKRRLNGEGG